MMSSWKSSEIKLAMLLFWSSFDVIKVNQLSGICGFNIRTAHHAQIIMFRSLVGIDWSQNTRRSYKRYGRRRQMHAAIIIIIIRGEKVLIINTWIQQEFFERKRQEKSNARTRTAIPKRIDKSRESVSQDLFSLEVIMSAHRNIQKRGNKMFYNQDPCRLWLALG